MEDTRTLRPAPDVLAEVAALLDTIDPDRALLTDSERLTLLTAARTVAGRVRALAGTLAAEAAAVEAADRHAGVPLASWLAATDLLTRREAHRLIGQGRDLTRFPHLTHAALTGQIGIDQAHAIAQALLALPDDFSPAHVAEAEETLIDYANQFDSHGLQRLARHLVEVIDPDGNDERQARTLERDLKTAKAARHLTFTGDGHGSILIRGSLPTLDAEPLRRLVDAYAQTEHRHALDRDDPVAEIVTPRMRRADGLCALAAAHQRHALAPGNGGDRPRIVVTLDYHRLRDHCITAGVLDTDQPITAGELRQLACDADILPVVLGGASEPLDVGRSQRLVTPTLRAALTLRDQGCVFPGCDAPASVCHAHHLTPWWAGGTTALTNLALVCPHHHNLVEPARTGPPGNRWRITLDHHGLPQAHPPDRLPDHTPHQHQRFALRRLA